jgi:hypothetical protein
MCPPLTFAIRIFFGIGLVGYSILVASRNPTLSYIATYLAARCVVHGRLQKPELTLGDL